MNNLSKELHLTRKDFKVDWFSGTGAGGQYRNKHQNCCRITHLETKLVATGQSHRDRIANQKEAFKTLVGKILAYYSVEKEPEYAGNRVVRTYHFERNVVTDGTVEKSTGAVMDGDIDEFLKAALQGQGSLRTTGRM